MPKGRNSRHVYSVQFFAAPLPEKLGQTLFLFSSLAAIFEVFFVEQSSGARMCIQSVRNAADFAFFRFGGPILCLALIRGTAAKFGRLCGVLELFT